MASAHSAQASLPGRRRVGVTRAAAVTAVVLAARGSPAPPPPSVADQVPASVAGLRLGSVTDSGSAGGRCYPMDGPVRDPVKVRLVNEMDSDHPMHHPFHLHGAGRFLVLARDGVVEDGRVIHRRGSQGARPVLPRPVLAAHPRLGPARLRRRRRRLPGRPHRHPTTAACPSRPELPSSRPADQESTMATAPTRWPPQPSRHGNPQPAPPRPFAVLRRRRWSRGLYVSGVRGTRAPPRSARALVPLTHLGLRAMLRRFEGRSIDRGHACRTHC
jgi:hypothetical protein